MKGRNYMQLCRCQKIKRLKVEADIGADSLWCNRCLANLELEAFPLMEDMMHEVYGEVNR